MYLEPNQLRIRGKLVSFKNPKKSKIIKSGIFTFSEDYTLQGNMLIPNVPQPNKQINGRYIHKTKENESIPEWYFFESSTNSSNILVAHIVGTPSSEKSLNKDYQGLYKIIDPSNELESELKHNPQGLNHLINGILNKQNNPTGIITLQAYVQRRKMYK